MKRYFLVCLLGLAAVAMTRQEAAAEFRMGFELNIGHSPSCDSWHCGHCTLGFSVFAGHYPPFSPKYQAKWGGAGYGDFASYDAGYGYGHDSAEGYTGHGDYGYYGGYAATSAPTTAPAAKTTAPAPAATVQPTGYHTGYYPTPSYWYGR